METQSLSVVTRRNVVAGFVIAGICGPRKCTLQQIGTTYPVTPDAPMKPILAKEETPKGPDKPVGWNRPSQLGVIMSDPEIAGQEGTIYLARWGDKELTDYAVIERKNIIPASMQKSYSALLIVDMLQMPNIYGKLAADGTPNMESGSHKLITLNDMVEIKASAANLNTTRYKQPGQKVKLKVLLEAALQRSDNGAIEALAVHCGQKLMDAGYVKDDGAPGAAHRAFNRWGEQQAREVYKLSPQFRMINAHGLPGYETLVDIDAFRTWAEKQNRQPWSTKVTTAENRVPHFGKRNAMESLKEFEQLPVESGICTAPTANNCWGWLDGVRIMAQWQMRHADKLALFDSENGKMAGQLKLRFKSLLGKTGTSWAAGECLHVIGDCGTAKVYGLAAGGKLGTRTRYARVAQVLNMFGQPKPAPAQPSLPTAQPALTGASVLSPA